jgi:hypothetical protein
VRNDRSIARSLLRTTTGSTGKALLAQSLCEAGIEDAAQVSLVQIAPQDVLGNFCAPFRQWIVQEAAPLEDPVSQWRRSVFEYHEIDRVCSKALARVAEEGKTLSPAGVRAELFAKNHGEIDVRPRPFAAAGPRTEQVDCGDVRVTAPGLTEGPDPIGEILGHWTLRAHVAIVRPGPRQARGEKTG